MTWLAIALAAASSYLLFRGFFVEPYDLEVVERELFFPGLPAALDGLRIAHLSDLHLRRIDDVERRALDEVRRAAPDVICLTGDFVEEKKDLQLLVPYLMELCRGKRSFAVLGNHDYGEGADPDGLKRELGRAGVRVLVNEAVEERLRGVRLRVAGVDDPHTGRADAAAALGAAGAAEEGAAAHARGEGERPAFTLLLAHSPDVLLDPASAGADLVLCGHTHGGQVRLPLVGPLFTNTRIGRQAAAGEAEIGGVRCYVSRGLGASGIRARLYCRPELALLTLRRGPG